MTFEDKTLTLFAALISASGDTYVSEIERNQKFRHALALVRFFERSYESMELEEQSKKKKKTIKIKANTKNINPKGVKQHGKFP